jgi:hypothetical protein
VPHSGAYWLNDQESTNITSLKHMADKFQVTYDSNGERNLNINLLNKIIKFNKLSNSLYGTTPKTTTVDIKNTTPMQLPNTTKEHISFLTPRQIERSKCARKLHEAMGAPTTDDLKAMVRMNLIKDNEVTTEDINLAVCAFGPDVSTIKDANVLYHLQTTSLKYWTT